MTAEIVSVGTELLLGQIADTNAQELGRVFAECGILHTHRQTVGDNLARLTEALRLALSRAELVVTIGGLGPTEDDLTREGIAEALGSPLVHDPALEERLRKVFADRRLPWVDSQLRQALRPACSRAVENPHGTAPGLIAESGGRAVIALPGPRGEFVPMLEGPVRAFLSDRGGGRTLRSRVLRVVGMGESVVEERLRDLMRGDDPTVAPYAKLGEVHVRVSALAESAEAAEGRISPVVAEVKARLGPAVYGEGDETLEAVVVALLRQRGLTLGVAESCTGGGLGARITAVPGSSETFVGGVVAYANEAKVRLLGVSANTLSHHGAVSAEAAAEMAQGARRALGVDWACSVTGVAGPGGGSEEKPVGLVYLGVAGPGGTTTHRQLFPGIRESVRARSVQMALVFLRDALLRDR